MCHVTHLIIGFIFYIIHFNYVAPRTIKTYLFKKIKIFIYLQLLIKYLKNRSASYLCLLVKLMWTPSSWFVIKSRWNCLRKGKHLSTNYETFQLTDIRWISSFVIFGPGRFRIWLFTFIKTDWSYRTLNWGTRAGK